MQEQYFRSKIWLEFTYSKNKTKLIISKSADKVATVVVTL